MPQRKHIVFSLLGSLGDLHPYLAIALVLQQRGHRCCIATTAIYAQKCRDLGLDFTPIRPALPGPEDPEALKNLLGELMDPIKGTGNILKQIILPHVHDIYTDLYAATADTDLLVTHVLPLVGPLVAAQRRLPWVSTVLAPMSMFSVYDPPIGTVMPSIGRLVRLHPWFGKLYLRAIEYGTKPWVEPIYRLRRELGLPRGQHPLFAGQHSPALTLALFSDSFAAAQADWPQNARTTGFPFHDQRGLPGDVPELAPELDRFLDQGAPPLVFTLGSAAVWTAGDFYATSIRMARNLGERAVLLVGDKRNLSAAELPEDILAVDYAPYSRLLPRAKLVVHHGGIGTTAQTLHAGVPALVVPLAHDQGDNAARIVRLGLGAQLPLRRYDLARAQPILQRLLSDQGLQQRARNFAGQLAGENGALSAALALEQALAKSG